MKVLLVSRGLSIGNDNGGRRYVTGLLSFLVSRGVTTHYLALESVPGLQRLATSLAPGLTASSLPLPWARPVDLTRTLVIPFVRDRVDRSFDGLPAVAGGLHRSFRRRIETVTRRLLPPLPWDRSPNDTEIALFRDAITVFRPDLVLVTYSWLAPLFDAIPDSPRVRKGILLIDILHERVESFRRTGSAAGHGDWTPTREAALWRKADLLAAISEGDANAARALVPGMKVVTVPFSVPVIPAPAGTSRAAARCLFVGSDSPHNTQGILWFVAEVWPGVLAARADAELVVVGSAGRALGRLPRGVRRFGGVPSLTPFFHEASLCVAPLLSGSGLKIKVVEAIAHGRVTVATSLGAQGMEDAVGQGVVVADTPERLAANILGFFDDSPERRRLEGKALAYAREKLESTFIYSPLLEELRISTSLEPERLQG